MVDLSVLADATADNTSNINALWLIVGAAMVLLMTPGLAFFYGGMVKAKSVISMMMMSFGAIALVSVLWVLYGYSMSFGLTDGKGHITDWVIKGWLLNPFANVGLNQFIGTGTTNVTGGFGPMAAANPGDTYSLAFVAFQATFAIITVALISGAIADRAKFGPWMIFAGLWATLVYFPVASWVFNFAVNAKGVVTDGGWSVFGLGVNDFAGGTAVHINAGAAGLALALVLGKRVGFAKGIEQAAQRAADPARCRAAVVRLVRLQRRFGRRGQHDLDHRLDQHPRRPPPPASSAGSWWRRSRMASRHRSAPHREPSRVSSRSPRPVTS